jgi:hypothetical protein
MFQWDRPEFKQGGQKKKQDSNVETDLKTASLKKWERNVNIYSMETHPEDGRR